MTLQEFIEKTKTDAALNEKVNAAIMEKVILPMAQAEGVELSDEELMGVAGGFGVAPLSKKAMSNINFSGGKFQVL